MEKIIQNHHRKTVDSSRFMCYYIDKEKRIKETQERPKANALMNDRVDKNDKGRNLRKFILMFPRRSVS